jgi:TatD DNase family protein
MLVDSHCHLDRLKLDQCGGSVASAIQGANDDGVKHLLCVCVSAENRQQVLDIASAHPGVFASAGVHPCDVDDAEVPTSDLIQWCEHPKVVALGETGLDYHYSRERESVQKASFINHLTVGKALGLPVIVHTREAREDTIELIRQHGCRQSAGVLHCFTETWEMAQAALDLNYYISISGIVTFKNAAELRDVAMRVPLDRLLIETDSPYLAPIPFRGKSNQPRYVRAVAEFVAQLRGMSLESLAAQTTDNFFNLFSKARR